MSSRSPFLRLPPSAATLPDLTPVVEAPPVELLVEHEHTCPRCGAVHVSLFRGTSAMCPDCTEKLRQAALAPVEEQSEAERQAARLAAWHDLCPPDYRSTRWKDHPELSPLCRWVAKYWWLPGAERDAMQGPDGVPVFGTGSQRGLGLFGPTGRGKTRAMYAILRRLHFAGVTCAAVQAIQFAEAAMLIAERAPWNVRAGALDLIRTCHRVPVLLFDDLGKENSTPAVAKAMHDLVEERKAFHRTLLWTSERTADELAQFLGTNYADGIVRRIGEITRIFHTEEAIPTQAGRGVEETRSGGEPEKSSAEPLSLLTE